MNFVVNSGLCVGIGVGFLRHLHVTNDFVIDIICADFVINTTLAGIWITAEKYNASVPKKVPDPEVFHVTSKGFYLTSREFFSYSYFPHSKNKKRSKFEVLLENIELEYCRAEKKSN